MSSETEKNKKVVKGEALWAIREEAGESGGNPFPLSQIYNSGLGCICQQFGNEQKGKGEATTLPASLKLYVCLDLKTPFEQLDRGSWISVQAANGALHPAFPFFAFISLFPRLLFFLRGPNMGYPDRLGPLNATPLSKDESSGRSLQSLQTVSGNT